MRKRGFSLIELMVAMSIIAILATIGITSYVNAQKRARDGRRKADLEQIRSALEMYRVDNNTYPTGGWLRVDTDADNTLTTELVDNGYLSALPLDPKKDDNGNPGPCYTPSNYRYNYWSSDGSSYFLTAIMESDTSNDDSPCLYDDYCGGGHDGAMEDVCYEKTNP